MLLHEVTQTLADEGLHVGILVGAGSLGFCHQFLDLRVDRSQSDAVLLGVDDESGETQSDEDGGTCDGCPPVLLSGQQVPAFFFAFCNFLRVWTYQGRPSSVWSATRPSVNQPVILRMPWSYPMSLRSESFMAAWTASSELSTSWTLLPEWRMRSSRVGVAASAGGCGRRSAAAGGRGAGGCMGCWLCLHGVAEKLRASRRERGATGRGRGEGGRRAAVRSARCMAERASMACRVPVCECRRQKIKIKVQTHPPPATLGDIT